MPNPQPSLAFPVTATGDVMKRSRLLSRDRMMVAGLVGAGVLTMTWWTLIACGLWRAIEWASA